MLTAWPVTRAGVSCAALARVMMPSSSSANASANSGASILSVKRSHRALIIAVVRGDLCGRLVDALAEQVVVQHLARDRRRRARAEAGVFHHYRERDLRVFQRGEGYEQGVIAVALGHVLLVVFLVLLQRDQLRRAGLAGAGVFGLGEGARTRALGIPARQGALDELDVLRLPRYGALDLGLDQGAFAAPDVLDVIDQVRAVDDAVVGYCRHRLRHLQRRVGVVALTDADADGFARIPFLLLGFLEMRSEERRVGKECRFR